MKKTFKWIGIILLTPIVLFVVLTLLLYCPPVQNWAVRQVASYASRETGMDIRVGHVRLVFPLDLGIDDIKVIRQNDSLPQVKDTIADITRVTADVQLLPLLSNRVEIDGLDLRHLKVNTSHFIHEARIKGSIGRLHVQAHGIDLGAELVRVDYALLSDAVVDITLSDTVPPDTTPSTNFWKVNIDRLKLDRTRLDLHMPGDTMEVNAYMGKTLALGARLDLHKGSYEVASLDWKDGQLRYDMNYEAHVKGLDFNHLALDSLTLKADSFFYGDSRIDVCVRQCRFKERSGLAVTAFTGPFRMDSVSLSLPALWLQTPETTLKGSFRMALNAFDDTHPGTFTATINRADLGKHDILRFADLPLALRNRWPNRPLSVSGAISGNLRKLDIRRLSVSLPTVLRLRADGFVMNPTDSKRLKAHVALDAKAYNLAIVEPLLDRDLRQTLHIPQNIAFKGTADVAGSTCASTFTATQGGGSLRGTVSLDTDKMRYHARLAAQALPLHHFLPHMGLHALTGTITADGTGTDFLSPRTKLNLKADIARFGYAAYDLSHIKATASVGGGTLHARLVSGNALLKGTVGLDALAKGRRMRGTITADVTETDLQRLGVSNEMTRASGCAYLDWETDFKHYYRAQGMLNDISIADSGSIYRPDDIVMDALTTRDTTHAAIDCGDFHLDMDGQGGYERLMSQCSSFMKELQTQLKDRHIDQERLRGRLPMAHVGLRSGKDNFFVRLLGNYGYQFSSVAMDMTASPATGLNGDIEADSLVLEAIRLDTVRLALRSDETQTTYAAQVRNNKDNPQYTFNALFDGALNETGTHLTTAVYDQNDSLGVRLGLSGSMETDGLRLRLYGDDPILGYKRFHASDTSYVFLGDDRRISANLKLTADDGMGVQVYSDDSNTDALQDLTLSLHRFDIEKILSVLPYTPDIKGVLDGDFHAIQTEKELTVSSSINVAGMSYENCPMGNVGTEFVYTPQGDSLHQVNGFLYHDGDEVATLSGTYRNEGDGYLDATFGLERLPLAMANGFIPDRLFGLKGYAEGSLSVKGSLAKPDVNGEVVLDSGLIFSEPYGVEMRFADDPVAIQGSRLLFENFEMFSHNDSPLDISGSFDFSDPAHMTLNTRMRARNFLLIDSKENQRSETYGKMFVNFFGMMSGPVDALRMRGRLDVLGSTDMTYVLRDSPLTTDNQLDELVTFTNFNDSTPETVERPPLTGLDMALGINIDEGAHVVCALNAEHSNYIDIIGGGELTMEYNATDDLTLRGRYTINSGEMKYALPVIPLKTFTIQDGSYIEFRGNPYNPTLNITATERTKASVSTDGSNGRTVAFDCGVVITKTLEDMGLEFIIDAPEDMTVSGELNTKSKEERGKLAVTMLTTGMYLADGNTSGFSMNSALSSFLQSQINNISGSALRTLDLSFGVDNATNSSGSMQTDYSFKFAKRFWNNRLNIQVGGKVSTGADVSNQNENFFDNVTFEYRLDQNASKYIKLFYNRDSYDWLEGTVGEYGAGFIWKRKLRHFKDLFKLKDDNGLPLPGKARKDTTATPSGGSGKSAADSTARPKTTLQ